MSHPFLKKSANIVCAGRTIWAHMRASPCKLSILTGYEALNPIQKQTSTLDSETPKPLNPKPQDPSIGQNGWDLKLPKLQA